MKKIAVGKSTFNESRNSRGDFRSSRVTTSRIPRGSGSDDLRTVTCAARWTVCQICSCHSYEGEAYKVVRAYSAQVHPNPR